MRDPVSTVTTVGGGLVAILGMKLLQMFLVLTLELHTSQYLEDHPTPSHKPQTRILVRVVTSAGEIAQLRGQADLLDFKSKVREHEVINCPYCHDMSQLSHKVFKQFF